MQDREEDSGSELTQNHDFGQWWLAFLLGGAVLVAERTLVARLYEFCIRVLAWAWVLSGRAADFIFHACHHLIGR